MQNKVAQFNREEFLDNNKMPVYARIINIGTEVGDLEKEYLNVTCCGKKPFKYNRNFEIEFGDVIYSVMSLANELGVDANKVLDKTILKLKTRNERKKNIEFER